MVQSRLTGQDDDGCMIKIFRGEGVVDGVGVVEKGA